MKNSKEKAMYFGRPKINIVGSDEDENKRIWCLEDDGVMFRTAEFDSGLGGETVEILQLTDLHLNCMNVKDCIEQRPCIISTRENRIAFRDGYSVKNTVSSMKLSSYFDETVITGDIIDYLTWGSLELMNELVLRVNPNTLMCIGGHDITRVMQGKVSDDTTIESRYDILRSYWTNDIFYFSKTAKDKVILVLLNNDRGRYNRAQGEKLLNDIKKARNNGQIILIFQHEPICTHNENEKNVDRIRENDPSASRDFYSRYAGNDLSDDETKEVYKTITENADVIKGVFCGHYHCDLYTEIVASYIDDNMNKCNTVIPQYILTGNMYDNGHALIISVK